MRRMMRRLHVTLFRYESPWWGACCGLAATTESRNQPQGRKKLCERGTPPAGTPVFRDGLGGGGGPDGDALEAPGPPIDQRASTMWVACSVGTFSVTRKPRPGRSMPANRDSPWPRTTGDCARCNSSIAPASRYWRTVETPPPIFTSRSPAAALAWASAASIPSVTKWKVVPPSITIGARAWCVRMNVGAWYGGLSPHQPFQSGPPQSSPAGPNILRPRMKAPKPSAAALAKRSSIPPSFPTIDRKARVGKNQFINSWPRLPSGYSRLWAGPAPKPSMDTPKPATRTLPMGPPFDCELAKLSSALLDDATADVTRKA